MGTEMKRVSALQFGVGRTLGALVPGAKLNTMLATLTISDAHKKQFRSLRKN